MASDSKQLKMYLYLNDYFFNQIKILICKVWLVGMLKEDYLIYLLKLT